MRKYNIVRTNKFKKEYENIKKQKFFKEKDFTDVVDILAMGEQLPEKYKNHLLEPKSKRVLRMSYKARLALNI